MKKLETSQIIENILTNRVITEREVLLLKKRANNGDNEAANFYPGCDIEIEVTEEQGAKGLNWLKKFIKKNGGSNVYGYRELEIINNASPCDFVFKGFYDAGNGWLRNFLPIYQLNGMEYAPMSEPYIIG